jgi:hypothetical protein
MFRLKTHDIKRNRAIGMAMLGASLAIQMVPPVLQAWASVLGLGTGTTMTGIAAVYLVLLAIVLSRRHADKTQ